LSRPPNRNNLRDERLLLMENKKLPFKFYILIAVIVAVSMLLANLLTIYSVSQAGYVEKIGGEIGLAGIIILTDVVLIIICILSLLNMNRYMKGK
jgi:ATP/ADP translocase